MTPATRSQKYCVRAHDGEIAERFLAAPSMNFDSEESMLIAFILVTNA
jgi:hypothetical protein